MNKPQFTEPVEYLGHLIDKHYYDTSWLMADWTGPFASFQGDGEYVCEMSHDLDSIKDVICQRVIQVWEYFKSPELEPLINQMVCDYWWNDSGLICEMQSGRLYEVNQADFQDWLEENYPDDKLPQVPMDEPDYVSAETERAVTLRLEEFIQAGEPGVWERQPGDREGAQWWEREKEREAPEGWIPDTTPNWPQDREDIYH